MAQNRFPNRQINYGAMVERALRSVVRETLALVAQNGLAGRHHVYITFRTRHPGVAIPDSLLARYPSEMTIVLQHEYWALEVGEDAFGVTLSFNNAPHRLEIPFEAITVFADPSVEFGLQFTQAEPAEASPQQGREPATVAELPKLARETADGGAEVVTLDRFRKK